MTSVWLGEMLITGYDVVIVDRNESLVRSKLREEWNRIHKTYDGDHAETFADLEAKADVHIREIEVGKVVWL